MCPVNTYAYTKTESVFSNLNTDGVVNKTTVTNHICSKTKEEYIDNSSLEDIINLNDKLELLTDREEYLEKYQDEFLNSEKLRTFEKERKTS